MKTINVAELKTHLSRCLRLVQRGERFVVLDRRRPVAELVPLPERPATAAARLVEEGRVRPPKRRLAGLSLTPLGRDIGLAQILDDVREEAT
jgi:antitoxin (DNA-binding transcriptional repressor) of toxin-antitoxin stability system